jgi:hypothetical protein
VEPPSADPHARWCGGCRQQWRRLPDFVASLERSTTRRPDSRCRRCKSSTIRSRSLSNRAASRCRDSRICCVIGLVIRIPRYFGRGANDWWFKSRIAADPLDLRSHGSVGDVLEIPCHQVLYALNCRYGNMQRVSRLGLRYSTLSIEYLCQRSSVVRNGEDCQTIENIQSLLCGQRITIAAFIDYKLRYREFVLGSCGLPTISCCLFAYRFRVAMAQHIIAVSNSVSARPTEYRMAAALEIERPLISMS